MTAADIDAQAKALYERNTLAAPRWEDLGGTTRAVWRERIAGAATPTPPPKLETTGATLDLFS